MILVEHFQWDALQDVLLILLEECGSHPKERDFMVGFCY
jgi:hypothetical protein